MERKLRILQFEPCICIILHEATIQLKSKFDVNVMSGDLTKYIYVCLECDFISQSLFLIEYVDRSQLWRSLSSFVINSIHTSIHIIKSSNVLSTIYYSNFQNTTHQTYIVINRATQQVYSQRISLYFIIQLYGYR